MTEEIVPDPGLSGTPAKAGGTEMGPPICFRYCTVNKFITLTNSVLWVPLLTFLQVTRNICLDKY